MKKKEIKELSVEELQTKLGEFKKQHADLKNSSFCYTIRKSPSNQKGEKNRSKIGNGNN